MTSTVRLVPMSESDYERFRARLVREYAADKVAAGNWPEEGSLAKSEAELRSLLVDGLATAGHHLWRIEDDARRGVGDLWVAVHPTRAGELYVYDIDIEPESRGQGIGRLALDALDAWARNAGFRSISLQVFGSNAVARRLYARSGYVETNVLMRKEL